MFNLSQLDVRADSLPIRNRCRDRDVLDDDPLVRPAHTRQRRLRRTLSAP
jgi:hypothetical protein